MSKATRMAGKMVTFVAPNKSNFKPTKYTGRVVQTYRDGTLKVNVAEASGKTEYMVVNSKQVKAV